MLDLVSFGTGLLTGVAFVGGMWRAETARRALLAAEAEKAAEQKKVDESREPPEQTFSLKYCWRPWEMIWVRDQIFAWARKAKADSKEREFSVGITPYDDGMPSPLDSDPAWWRVRIQYRDRRDLDEFFDKLTELASKTPRKVP